MARKQEAPAKKYTLRFTKKDKPTFEFIRNEKKKVETRAATVRYASIRVGDIVVLSCAGEKFEKKVAKARKFKTITGLLKVYKPNLINPGAKTLKEMEAMYYSFPGYKEKIKQFGLIALEFTQP